MNFKILKPTPTLRQQGKVKLCNSKNKFKTHQIINKTSINLIPII